MAHMFSHELVAKALDVSSAMLALSNEQFEAEGALFVRDRQFPSIYDSNHVTHITASTPAEMDRLLARAEREYEHAAHRRFVVDFRTHPVVTARLALESYARDDTLISLLEGDLIGSPEDHDVRPVETDEDWAAYAGLKRADWNEHSQRLPEPRPGPEIAEAFIQIFRRKAPEVQYFLAYADGRPAAFLSSWPGINGMGQVEDLFALPEYRHRGLATSLLHRCVRDCRDRGARRIVIASDPTDTPKHMYAAMGFVPVALDTHYLKRLDLPAPVQ